MSQIPPIHSSRYTSVRRTLKRRAPETPEQAEESRYPVKPSAERRKRRDRRQQTTPVNLERRRMHRRRGAQRTILGGTESDSSKGGNINTTA